MAKETSKAKPRRAAKAPTAALGTPKVTKRSSVPKKASQKKRKPNTAVFGPEAPPAQLRMPQNDNITATELIVFLPNIIRSHDFLYRFMQNGLDTPTLTTIVNFHRRPTKGEPIPINSFCKIIEKTMREAGHEKWTVGKHKAGEFQIGDGEWDANNLTCRGFRLNCEEFPEKKPNDRGVLDNVPFAALAHDIERYPSEETGDALDLTRCVKFAAANAHLSLLFPRDFGFLKRLSGGPSLVTAAHRDYCVFDRWRISARKAEYIANADVTGFEMHQYKFTYEQVAVVNDYLEKVENGEEPSLVQSSEASHSSSAPTEASEYHGSPSTRAQASEDSGHSFTMTQTSGSGDSQSMLTQGSDGCEESSLTQSSEDGVENCPVRGRQQIRDQSSLAYPGWWSDVYDIKLSAQQPTQHPVLQYQGYSVPYFQSTATWNNSPLEYSTADNVMPFVQPNVAQYGHGYDYYPQDQDSQPYGSGHQFHGLNNAEYVTPMDHSNSYGYAHSNVWANGFGYH